MISLILISSTILRSAENDEYENYDMRIVPIVELSDIALLIQNDSIGAVDSAFVPVPGDRTIGDVELGDMKKDPTAAMLWSIIPGGGQFYNESYLKSGLFLVSASMLTGFTVYNYYKFFPLQDQYDSNIISLSLLDDTDPLRFTLEQENRTVLNRKENFRDNAHLSLFLLGISYFVATMDAYVGAHLYDFDVDDDISYMIVPNPVGGASLALNIDINKPPK
jgi:hypothetical protein